MSTIIQSLPQQQIKKSQAQQFNPQQIQSINPIILLKQPQIFKQTFAQIIKNGQICFKSKDIQNGIIFFNKALDMIDLGKHILKNYIGTYVKLGVLANLAYGNQALKKMQKSNRFCQRAKEQTERLIAVNKNQGNSTETYLKLSKFLITLKFQHCAIVSQLQQHQKALQMSKSTLPQLKCQIQTMLNYLNQSMLSSIKQKKSSQTVQFSHQVHKFAYNLLTQPLNFLNQPLKKCHFYYWQKNPQQNQQQVKKKFISSSLEIKNQCKRSILGVSKSTHWIDQFNIGTIMHMSMVSHLDFQQTLPMEEYFFKDKLYQIVIFCSLTYFTMATQIRFIQPIKQKQLNQQKQQIRQQNQNKQKQQLQSSVVSQLYPSSVVSAQERSVIDSSLQASQLGSQSLYLPAGGSSQRLSSNKSNFDKIFKKYGYQQRSQLFKLSQLYHIRSIEIISRNIKSLIPYLSHIIKSYDKHYLKKKQLEPIQAINDQSHMEQNQSMLQYLGQEHFMEQLSHDKRDDGMSQLLLDSHSHKASITKSKLISNQKQRLQQIRQQNYQNQGIDSIKNALNFDNFVQSISFLQSQESLLVQKQSKKDSLYLKSKIKTNLSQIIEDPKKQNQIKLYSRSPQDLHSDNENTAHQYLKSKKAHEQIIIVKKQNTIDLSKKKKSKSKLKLLKSRQKPNIQLLKRAKSPKDEKSSRSSMHTQRNQNEQKSRRHAGRSQSDHHKISNLGNQSTKTNTKHNQNAIQKFFSPQVGSQTKRSKKFKQGLSNKSKEKLMKKFITVPQSTQYESKKSRPNDKKQTNQDKQKDNKQQNNKQKDNKQQNNKQKGNKEKDNKQKGNKEKDNKQKGQKQQKQKKYFTTFDGEKQYRIKHQSTTHIKVVFKKKNIKTEKSQA